MFPNQHLRASMCMQNAFVRLCACVCLLQCVHASRCQKYVSQCARMYVNDDMCGCVGARVCVCVCACVSVFANALKDMRVK